MDHADIVIFACSSLRDYIDAAQQKAGTSYPIIFLDKENHMEPQNMKKCIVAAEQTLPATVKTVLIAMGFCGGALDHVTFSRRFIIPRVDDCVSLMLQKDGVYDPNPKQAGHLYMMEQDPDDLSFQKLLADSQTGYEGLSAEDLFHMYFDNYTNLDIIDTGLTDCYSEEYAAKAQATADQIHAALDYVEGSNLLLEKLVMGRWDDQFLVAEPGHLIRHADFFE